MRRVIRKRIRRTGDGVDLMADINAEIAINVGRSTVPPTERPPDAPTQRPTSASSGGSDPESRQSDASEPGGSSD
jgi:hypothetical protein